VYFGRKEVTSRGRNRRFMRFRRRNKRKTIVLARLLAGLDSEARRERRWEPGRAFRVSAGISR
jgi:hypothetical protein